MRSLHGFILYDGLENDLLQHRQHFEFLVLKKRREKNTACEGTTEKEVMFVNLRGHSVLVDALKKGGS